MAGNPNIRNFPIRNWPSNEREGRAFLRNLSLYVGDLVKAGEDRLRDELRLPMYVVGNRGGIQNIPPLTAQDLGGSVGAKITIAAHTVTFGDTAVYYAADTIGTTASPLAYSNGGDSIYYVYVDNPNFEGTSATPFGATKYAASTSVADTAGSGRYYVGSVTMPTDGGGDTTGGGGAGGGVSKDVDVVNGGIFP